MLAITFTFSCSGGGDDGSDGGNGGGGVGGTCHSDKGNNIANYKTKLIGNQVWMLENLNYKVEGSRCYGEGDKEMYYDAGGINYRTLSNSEIEANGAKYGRLYDWETTKKICSGGWHLPSDTEWETLFTFVGEETAATKLKANNGWNYNGNGTDNFGFTALPGGEGFPGKFFSAIGKTGFWWGIAEDNAPAAYSMDYDRADVVKQAIPTGVIPTALFSVRCVKD